MNEVSYRCRRSSSGGCSQRKCARRGQIWNETRLSALANKNKRPEFCTDIIRFSALRAIRCSSEEVSQLMPITMRHVVLTSSFSLKYRFGMVTLLEYIWQSSHCFPIGFAQPSCF